ncbi:olfactory receptor 1496-like [Amia ocellicauda]|uniref:olfactory receptor 1496-like n=1 Tax=Amia ocellicauda TaxID=2972642 RepID=UPI0034648427
MENSSHITSFRLIVFDEIGQIRYFYFSVILILYLANIFANSFLIGVIFTDRNLHEPMCYFVCNLAVNELYGSIGLFPSLLLNILSDNHEISRVNCIVQTFCLHTYGSIEFSSLAVMAYDRYESICHPLHYHSIMTPTKVYVFIVLIWLYSFSKFSIVLSLSVRLTLCGNIIEKVYCDNYSLVKLACSDTTINNYYGIFAVFLSIVLPVILILYSYIKMLRICLKASKGSQLKALNTCIPHLVSLVNFSISSIFEIVQSRFNMKHVPTAVRIIISVYFLIIPPLINPIIYGVRITKIRMAFKNFLCTRKLSPE